MIVHTHIHAHTNRSISANIALLCSRKKYILIDARLSAAHCAQQPENMIKIVNGICTRSHTHTDRRTDIVYRNSVFCMLLFQQIFPINKCPSGIPSNIFRTLFNVMSWQNDCVSSQVSGSCLQFFFIFIARPSMRMLWTAGHTHFAAQRPRRSRRSWLIPFDYICDVHGERRASCFYSTTESRTVACNA